MAGCVNMIQTGYTGLETRGDVLGFNPCLPENMGRLRLQIRYRGHNLSIEIVPGKLRVTAGRSHERPIKIGCKGDIHELEEGKTLSLSPETGFLSGGNNFFPKNDEWRKVW